MKRSDNPAKIRRIINIELSKGTRWDVDENNPLF